MTKAQLRIIGQAGIFGKTKIKKAVEVENGSKKDHP